MKFSFAFSILCMSIELSTEALVLSAYILNEKLSLLLLADSNFEGEDNISTSAEDDCSSHLIQSS